MNNTRRISVLHANSNALMHYGILKVCGKGGGFDKIVQVYNAEDLFNALKTAEYDVIVVDPRKEHGFGMDTVLKVQDTFNKQRILIISDVSDEDKVLQILERGVQGYLTYECDEDEIIHAIFSISKGEKFYCNKVLDIVFNKHLYKKTEDNCDATSLTSRETEVACLIAKGNTNREVAEHMYLSPHTIHTHRKNIMKKLGIRSASELTLYAVSTGLIEA